MSGIYNILIDDRLFKKVDHKIRRKEILLFGFLSAMIIVLSLIGGVATFVYIITIFKNILIASISALLMSLVLFNLIRLLIITSISAYHTKLGKYQLEHSLIFDDIQFSGEEEKDQLKILEVVNKKKESLRNISKTKGSYSKDFSQRFSFFIKILILTFLSLIFATGVELLIFSPQINAAFDVIKSLYANNPDTWVVSQALNPGDGNFYILNTNSILLAIDVLSAALGWIKYLIDATFVLLFVIPLFITYKSSRVFDSSYVKELALHEVSISYYSYLVKERACEKITESVLEYNLEHLVKSSEKLT